VTLFLLPPLASGVLVAPELDAGEREEERKKTWRTTIKEDLQLRGIRRCEVEAAAERTRWRYC